MPPAGIRDVRGGGPDAAQGGLLQEGQRGAGQRERAGGGGGVPEVQEEARGILRGRRTQGQ